MKGLKILVIMPGGGTAINVVLDSIEAFLELGHRIESCETESGTWGESLSREILRFRPDFVYSVNHIGIITTLLTERRILHISWFIDDPFLWWLGKEGMKRSISPYCTLFLCDRTHIDKLKRFGFENVYYLPFATSPKIFRPIELTKEEIERYSCNISLLEVHFIIVAFKDGIDGLRG
jgi:hypothetical protein